MARIEWQPLAIPDIGDSALRAQQASANSIRGAFQDLSGVLDQWKGQRREENLTELYRRQNRFASGAVGPDGQPTGIPDVAGYVGDLADGDLINDLSYLNAADIAAARSYTNELRSGRASEETRNRNLVVQGREDQVFDRTEAARVRSDEIAQVFAPLIAEAERTGDRSSLDAAMRTLAPEANAQQLDSMLTSIRGAVGEFQRNRNSELSYNSTKYTFDRSLETDRQNDRAQVILNQLATDHVDSRSALAALNSDYDGEDPKVLNALRAQIPTVFSTLDSVTAPPPTENSPGGSNDVTVGAVTYAAPAGGFLGGAADSSRVLNYEARAAGFARLPDRIRTVGDVSDYAIALNRRGVRSSATGTFQIVGQTLRGKNNQNGYAERVLGAGWRDVDWTPEVEDRIAEAIFNDNRGSAADLRKQWVSLTHAEAERVRQMPWAQARAIIAGGESGAVIRPAVAPASVRTSRANLEAGLAVGTDGGFSGNRTALAAGYLAATERPGINAQVVANELVGEGGSYAGLPQNRIRADIEALMNSTGVSAAVAGWALDQTRRNRGWGERLFSMTGVTGPVASNLPAARALIDQTKTPEMRDNVSLVQNNREILNALNSAEAADIAARQAYANALARVQANGGRGDISRYAAEVQRTSALLSQAQAAADNADISRPVGQREPAPQRPVGRVERSLVNRVASGPAPTRSLYRGPGSTDNR